MRLSAFIMALFFLANFYQEANAQTKLHVGVTTAVNSTFVLDKGLQEDPRYQSVSNYQWAPIGLALGVDVSEGFGLQIESIMASQGQIFEVIDVAKQVVGERRIELDYVHVPLLLKFMSKKKGRVKMNYSLGPQFSILTSGIETLEYAASTQKIPDGVTPPEGATPNLDGTYDVPALSNTVLISTAASTEFEKFKTAELQIAGGIGVDIDLTTNIYLSTMLRANYSITDMRNADLIDSIKTGNQVGDLFGKRANLLLGLQLGAHYVFGGI